MLQRARSSEGREAGGSGEAGKNLSLSFSLHDFAADESSAAVARQRIAEPERGTGGGGRRGRGSLAVSKATIAAVPR